MAAIQGYPAPGPSPSHVVPSGSMGPGHVNGNVAHAPPPGPVGPPIPGGHHQSHPPKQPQTVSVAAQKLAQVNEQTWVQIGSIAELMLDYDRAIRSYESALRHNPYSVKALSLAAALYRGKEQFGKAEEYFKRILQIQPENGDVWSALGHCYLMTDALQNAYHAYQQALYHLSNPQDPKLWYGIGILYDRYGTLEHAEDAFTAVIRMDPNFEKNDEVYFRLGIIYKQQGKTDLALECFRYILYNAPRPLTEYDIWFQIGHVHEQRKEYVLAKEVYERVLQHNPDHAKVLHQLGGLYHLQSTPFCNQEVAIQYLTRSITHDGGDPQTWYLVGRCYMAQQNFSKAYEAYQQAVYRDAKNPTFWCSIGVLYYQINQYRDALDAYSRALRINPNISEVWYDLGTLYENCNNQIPDAIDAYKRAAELDPTNLHIKQRLDLLLRGGSGNGNIGPAPAPQDPAMYSSESAQYSYGHHSLQPSASNGVQQQFTMPQPSPRQSYVGAQRDDSYKGGNGPGQSITSTPHSAGLYQGESSAQLRQKRESDRETPRPLDGRYAEGSPYAQAAPIPYDGTRRMEDIRGLGPGPGRPDIPSDRYAMRSMTSHNEAQALGSPDVKRSPVQYHHPYTQSHPAISSPMQPSRQAMSSPKQIHSSSALSSPVITSNKANKSSPRIQHSRTASGSTPKRSPLIGPQTHRRTSSGAKSDKRSPTTLVCPSMRTEIHRSNGDGAEKKSEERQTISEQTSEENVDSVENGFVQEESEVLRMHTERENRGRYDGRIDPVRTELQKAARNESPGYSNPSEMEAAPTLDGQAEPARDLQRRRSAGASDDRRQQRSFYDQAKSTSPQMGKQTNPSHGQSVQWGSALEPTSQTSANITGTSADRSRSTLTDRETEDNAVDALMSISAAPRIAVPKRSKPADAADVRCPESSSKKRKLSEVSAPEASDDAHHEAAAKSEAKTNSANGVGHDERNSSQNADPAPQSASHMDLDKSAANHEDINTLEKNDGSGQKVDTIKRKDMLEAATNASKSLDGLAVGEGSS